MVKLRDWRSVGKNSYSGLNNKARLTRNKWWGDVEMDKMKMWYVDLRIPVCNTLLTPWYSKACDIWLNGVASSVKQKLSWKVHCISLAHQLADLSPISKVWPLIISVFLVVFILYMHCFTYVVMKRNRNCDIENRKQYQVTH